MSKKNVGFSHEKHIKPAQPTTMTGFMKLAQPTESTSLVVTCFAYYYFCMSIKY